MPQRASRLTKKIRPSSSEWIPLSPGRFVEPIFFRCLPTGAVGKLHLELSRGELTKKMTIHCLDSQEAMQLILAKAQLWEDKILQR